jgi:WD40 repeat protein
MSEKTHAHSDYVMSVAFSPDGTKVFSGSRDGTI